MTVIDGWRRVMQRAALKRFKFYLAFQHTKTQNFATKKSFDCLLAGTPRIPWSQGNERFLLSDSHNALHAPVITHFIQTVHKITDFKELRTWML